MTNDGQLLRRYAEEGSEEAFRELASRYLDLVFSAALRQVGGDAPLAQDVAQLVFTALARKAPWLGTDVVLGGWLYRHTCFVAAQTMRTERRRRVREQKAAEMNELSDETEPSWDRLAPFLDGAMQRLAASDRNALILRYFQGRDLRAVGAALGTSEDAARMRVARALAKLREHFKRRGLTLSGTTLASLLGAHAVTSAPTGLGTAIIAPALAGAATSGAGISLLALKFMIMTKLKIGFAGALLVAGLTTPLILQRQSLNRLQEENSRLREQAQQLDRLRAENERLSKGQVDAAELARLRNQQNELLRLRGEANRLRQQARAGSQPSLPTPPPPPAAENSSPINTFETNARATIGATDTLVTGGWVTKPGNRTLVFVTPAFDPAATGDRQVVLHVMLVDAPETVWAARGVQLASAESKDNSFQQMLSAVAWKSLLDGLEKESGVDIMSSPTVSTADGRQAQISVTEQRTLPSSAEPVTLGPSIDLLPRLSQDGNSVDLTLHAQLNQLKDPPSPAATAASLYPVQGGP